MYFGKPLTVALAATALSGATMAPNPTDIASPAPVAQQVEAPAPDPLPVIVAPPAPAIAVEPAEETRAPQPRRAATAEIDPELECLAKVVLHEAGNQGRRGQIAVAEVVMNRVRSPRFPNSICGVVLQRGQFFNVHAYRPYRDRRWPQAVEIARQVRDGDAEQVTNGAFFFRSARGHFPGRAHVATIGDHRFYR
jgi:N-acetylmuramoyl-L-alanine amidase